MFHGRLRAECGRLTIGVDRSLAVQEADPISHLTCEGWQDEVLNIEKNSDLASFGAAKVINLDAAANTAPTEEVIQAIISALRSGAANPASAHELGDRSRTIRARARDSVLSLVTGAVEEGVIFTSGCTEANNTVFAGIAAATVITSAVEHPSVLRSASGARQALVNERLNTRTLTSPPSRA